MTEITEMSLAELLEKRESGEISPADIAGAFQKRIAEYEPEIEAFTALAENFVGRVKQGDGRLKGVPIAVKDNMATSNLPTTCASKTLKDYTPPYDATAVEKLKSAGAVVAGKTNMDEFAMGSTTEFSALQVTKNPWNLSHVPGGSSGGSAAAVAADMVPAALGSDTGGSIRQPAAFSGVVGLKPTYGVVSRYGLVAFASSLDQIGPITRSVEDAAIMLNIISGHDSRDSTSAAIDYPDYTSRLDRDVAGLIFGLPREYLQLDIDDEVKDRIEEAAGRLEEAGAEIRDISLPSVDRMLAAYYIISPAEASSNLARYDGVQYGERKDADSIEEMYNRTRSSGLGPEVKRRIMLGTYALSAGFQDDLYKQALRVRTLIKESYQQVFADVDIIMTPTTPTPAFRLEEEQDPIDVYYTDMFTVPANITGLPAISLPAGFSGERLPVGVQFIADAFGEPQLLQAARGLEKMLDLPSAAKLD